MTLALRMSLTGSIVFLGLVGLASADPLAPPGACAEKRVLDVGVAPSDFSVAGAVANMLSPVNVASAPLNAMMARPAGAKPLARPGACDSPGTGCGLGMPPAATPPAPPPHTYPTQAQHPPVPSGRR